MVFFVLLRFITIGHVCLFGCSVSVVCWLDLFCGALLVDLCLTGVADLLVFMMLRIVYLLFGAGGLIRDY